jgi:hypothetical protein
MKVHIVTYFNGEGAAGVSAVFAKKSDAKKHFKLCVENTFEGARESVNKEEVAKALKDGFYEYCGDGHDDNPWYELTEEVVQ